MSNSQPTSMDLPPGISLPFFVYGALKPGMPAFEQLRGMVAEPIQADQTAGELYVRDGLPLLKINGDGNIMGFLLHWKPGEEQRGYTAVCAFEPRTHYKWEAVTLKSGAIANALGMRFPSKGNPQPFQPAQKHSSAAPVQWCMSDDPAFGPGLDAVTAMVAEIGHMPQGSPDADWPRFFKAQMAYLLLWSILERLSALCVGPGQDPMYRVKRLHELPGMAEAVLVHVHRTDQVSDSRNPDATCKLNGSTPKACFDYYYQLRSNLSHRGKAVCNEFDKVHKSLNELLAITQQYLGTLSS